MLLGTAPHDILAIAPFVVPAIMSAISLAKGIADNSAAKRQRAEARRLHDAIPNADPGVLDQLNQLRLRQRYAETGQSWLSNTRRQSIQDANAQTQVNLLRGSGTSPGSLQQGLLRSQVQTQNALQQAAAGDQQAAIQYMTMQTPLISDIADRTMSLQSYLRDNANFQSAQTQQNANNAITGALGTMASYGLKSAGAGTTKVDGTGAAAPVQGVPGPGENMIEVEGIGQPGQSPWWQSGPLFGNR